MYIEFDKEYLRELYTDGKTANRITDLFRNNALNYEALHGDKEGTSSVRINRKYRLEFTVREIMDEQIITVCRLLDISNHYK